MILRLFLTVMLALGTLAAPAAAPCHEAMPMAGHAMPHAPDKTALAHVCIGCIPPGDWSGARVTAPQPPRPVALVSTVAALDLGEAPPPALPPPRVA